MPRRDAWWLLLALSACPTQTVLPGDEALGSYGATAVPVATDCQLTEVVEARADGGGTLTFDATISRDSTSGATWLSIAGYSRDAGFDGQVLISTVSATRVFAQCGGCQNRMVETIAFAVLSRSQSDAVGGVCPDDVLDGGVPRGEGIAAPSQTDAGYDGVRLCGVIEDRLEADGLADGGACDPVCAHCTLRYQLRATRR